MKNVFHGPFRIVGADISINRDGEFFVYFKDGKNNVIGTVFDTETVIQLSQAFEAAALQVVLTPEAAISNDRHRIRLE